MADIHLPKQIFYSELSDGTRNLGKPNQRYKDSLKDNLKLCELNIGSWKTEAQDRSAWKVKCRKALKHLNKTKATYGKL